MPLNKKINIGNFVAKVIIYILIRKFDICDCYTKNFIEINLGMLS